MLGYVERGDSSRRGSQHGLYERAKGSGNVNGHDYGYEPWRDGLGNGVDRRSSVRDASSELSEVSEDGGGFEEDRRMVENW